MRLFLAIQIPDLVRQHLDQLRQELDSLIKDKKAVSWVKPENWHVTLRFLGDVPDDKLPPLIDALKRIPVNPMTLHAQQMLYFPKNGPVRVIGAQIAGDTDQLTALHARIESALVLLGFAKEDRPFTAHITFARWRTGSMKQLRSILLPHLFPGPSFQASIFTLMQSNLDPKGAQYSQLRVFPDSSQENTSKP